MYCSTKWRQHNIKYIISTYRINLAASKKTAKMPPSKTSHTFCFTKDTTLKFTMNDLCQINIMFLSLSLHTQSILNTSRTSILQHEYHDRIRLQGRQHETPTHMWNRTPTYPIKWQYHPISRSSHPPTAYRATTSSWLSTTEELAQTTTTQDPNPN